MNQSKRSLDLMMASRPHVCHWCDCTVTRCMPHASPDQTTATSDHLLPRERGGAWDQYNIVLSCKRCNEHRAAAGHCMAALDCAYDVLGAGAPAPFIHRWLRPHVEYRSTASSKLADIWPQQVSA